VSAGVFLVLFVLLPLVLAPLVIWFVARRSPELPVEYRISHLLEHGEPAHGELLEWKNKGPFLLDSTPMVEYRLRVTDAGDPFELRITQSTPRRFVNRLQPGMSFDLRLSSDHTAGAIVLPLE